NEFHPHETSWGGDPIFPNEPIACRVCEVLSRVTCPSRILVTPIDGTRSDATQSLARASC
ncbi:MAG: hypothetical protein O2931_15530, partial [Planctomycetota bacterium]|nr:hypothetical protein [Planctomycetota bacterium]